jgi:hypothetical protein
MNCEYCDGKIEIDDKQCEGCGVSLEHLTYIDYMNDYYKQKAIVDGATCPHCGGKSYKCLVVSRRTCLFSNKVEAAVYSCIECNKLWDGEWYKPDWLK